MPRAEEQYWGPRTWGPHEEAGRSIMFWCSSASGMIEDRGRCRVGGHPAEAHDAITDHIIHQQSLAFSCLVHNVTVQPPIQRWLKLHKQNAISSTARRGTAGTPLL